MVAIGCGEMVDKSRAVKAAADEGYTGIKVKDQHGIAPWFYGCDKNDAVAFDVSALNTKGNRVEITVCCGLVLKGCTIRH